MQTVGHTVGSAVLGTIEFLVWELGSPLVIVLGHDSFGALNLSDDRSRIVTSVVTIGRLAVISATYHPTRDALQVHSVIGPVSTSSPGPIA